MKFTNGMYICITNQKDLDTLFFLFEKYPDYNSKYYIKTNPVNMMNYRYVHAWVPRNVDASLYMYGSNNPNINDSTIQQYQKYTIQELIEHLSPQSELYEIY